MTRRVFSAFPQKGGGFSSFKVPQKTHQLAIAALLSLGVNHVFGASLAANALPTGGQVAAGQATISQSGNTLNVNQSSQRAVINWNTFNVGANSTVNFNQPNASSSTLNRINGASQSMINGAVNSNGQVIFINPNGVIFGKGAEGITQYAETKLKEQA